MLVCLFLHAWALSLETLSQSKQQSIIQRSLPKQQTNKQVKQNLWCISRQQERTFYPWPIQEASSFRLQSAC